jgi:LysR family glycine cleavage system transcriptional activator
MRKLPPLNAIRAFEAAARHASFTRAAKELFVTHGAISKQVALLEAWLSTPLFQRSQSQVTLTEAGRTLLAAVTPALDRIAVTAMQLMEKNEVASLKVSAPPTFTMRWLIPRISAFQRRSQGVEVKLTTSTAPINFEQEGYDIAIRGGQRPFPGCVSTPFMTETILPICHPDLLEGGQLQQPEDLARLRLISYDTEPLSWSEWLGIAQVPELRPAEHLQFEQMYFALQAAAEGLGVVLVPLFLVADDIVLEKLCAPFGMRFVRQRQYFVNSPNTASHHFVLEEFKQWLIEAGRDTEQSITQLARTMD